MSQPLLALNSGSSQSTQALFSARLILYALAGKLNSMLSFSSVDMALFQATSKVIVGLWEIWPKLSFGKLSRFNLCNTIPVDASRFGALTGIILDISMPVRVTRSSCFFVERLATAQKT